VDALEERGFRGSAHYFAHLMSVQSDGLAEAIRAASHAMALAYHDARNSLEAAETAQKFADDYAAMTNATDRPAGRPVADAATAADAARPNLVLSSNKSPRGFGRKWTSKPATGSCEQMRLDDRGLSADTAGHAPFNQGILCTTGPAAADVSGAAADGKSERDDQRSGIAPQNAVLD